jgi:hypothetical protein
MEEGELSKFSSSKGNFTYLYLTDLDKLLQSVLQTPYTATRVKNLIELGVITRNPKTLFKDIIRLVYDEQYRLKKTRFPSSSWGIIDQELWILCVASSNLSNTMICNNCGIPNFSSSIFESAEVTTSNSFQDISNEDLLMNNTSTNSDTCYIWI